jgi:hypothetical protein
LIGSGDTSLSPPDKEPIKPLAKEPGQLGFVHPDELVHLLSSVGFEGISLRRLQRREGYVIALARKR